MSLTRFLASSIRGCADISARLFRGIVGNSKSFLSGLCIALSLLSQVQGPTVQNEIGRSIKRWAEYYELDEELVKATIFVESRFRVDARCFSYGALVRQQWHTNAMRKYGFDKTDPDYYCSGGLMQGLYITWKIDRLKKGLTDENSWNDFIMPDANIEFGCRTLRRYIDRYEGDIYLGLCGYNRGFVTILSNGLPSNSIYAEKVIGYYESKKTEN